MFKLAAARVDMLCTWGHYRGWVLGAARGGEHDLIGRHLKNHVSSLRFSGLTHIRKGKLAPS